MMKGEHQLAWCTLGEALQIDKSYLYIYSLIGRQYCVCEVHCYAVPSQGNLGTVERRLRYGPFSTFAPMAVELLALGLT